jgi:SM-20-related protein
VEKSFERLIDSYLADQVGICDHFLSEIQVNRLRTHLLDLHQNKKMRHAGTGNEVVTNYDTALRGDQIYWLEKEQESQFFDTIEAFVSYLNQTCYTGIKDYEFHYAHYAPGRGYKRHLDQFRSDSSRVFSVIIYLNLDWQEKDGGALRIFQGTQIQNIAPVAGRCVFFKSDQLEHEVMVTTRDRLSITGWLKV